MMTALTESALTTSAQVKNFFISQNFSFGTIYLLWRFRHFQMMLTLKVYSKVTTFQTKKQKTCQLGFFIFNINYSFCGKISHFQVATDCLTQHMQIISLIKLLPHSFCMSIVMSVVLSFRLAAWHGRIQRCASGGAFPPFFLNSFSQEIPILGSFLERSTFLNPLLRPHLLDGFYSQPVSRMMTVRTECVLLATHAQASLFLKHTHSNNCSDRSIEV